MIRTLALAALLPLLGGCVATVYVPIVAAGIGFASAEVGVLPALASDYLCYKGHVAECGPPTQAVKQ